MAPKKTVAVPVVASQEEAVLVEPHEVLKTSFDFSKKDNLLALQTILADLNVRSIGDLENLIAKAQ